jgi:hypothetical protein
MHNSLRGNCKVAVWQGKLGSLYVIEESGIAVCSPPSNHVIEAPISTTNTPNSCRPENSGKHGNRGFM